MNIYYAILIFVSFTVLIFITIKKFVMEVKFSINKSPPEKLSRCSNLIARYCALISGLGFLAMGVSSSNSILVGAGLYVLLVMPFFFNDTVD